jgi:hydrogenase maturation protein HypF
MAARHGLTGEVDNRTGGVSVILQADLRTVELFNDDIISNAPPASRIKSIQVRPVPVNAYETFKIAASRDKEDEITEISPDIAVCDDCLQDLQKDPFRNGYPFVNCTNCGPRFTIIEKLPYDRQSTSMKVFKMCSHCRQEYDDILDRRFHAQPVACNSCGPVYHYSAGSKSINDFSQMLTEIAQNIDEGKIIAMKGTGGYNLICNALNEDAVSELRRKKHRDAKPFAVMFRDTVSVKEYCRLNDYEQRQLVSWRRPILILGQRKSLAPSVSNGLSTTGAIIPYTPVHYLLFRLLKTPAIVYTSGNLSEEPIIADDITATGELSKVADAVVSYNRQIVNRVDDSVLRIAGNRIMLIRRSRGFVPHPVDLRINAEGVLAAGAEQKNSFCIGRGKQAIMSQYIGDLRNAATFDFFTESLENFRNIFRFRPAQIACDMHPG